MTATTSTIYIATVLNISIIELLESERVKELVVLEYWVSASGKTCSLIVVM